MVKKLKKGKKGAQANFITRSKAIRKLQLKLSDFRKLCILKGIYPREPKKHPKGKDKVYYHLKDIKFLAHEKLLDKFRELRAFSKKIKRSLSRGEKSRVKELKQNKPIISLNHLVKERYPSFIDAIRDLDDALCLLSLYSVLASHKLFMVSKDLVEGSSRLMREFSLYVIKSQSLRKVFLSIKGIYFQAEIMAQPVTWIVPYQFTQNMPPEVDYKIMNTFLQFYQTLIKFVNYKLYTQLGFNYPPKMVQDQEQHIYHSYKAFLLQNKTITNHHEQDINDKFQIDQQFQNSQEVQQIMGNINYKSKDLFKGLVFFLNREVPRYALEMTILSFGGEVYWDDDESDIDGSNSKVSHVIVDRPLEQLKIMKNKDYVQPQWVFDSVNNELLLPVKDYGPGKPLPPHLSPFVDNLKEQYIPERQQQIDAYKKQHFDQEIVLEDPDDNDTDNNNLQQNNYDNQEEHEEEEEYYDHKKEQEKKEKQQKLVLKEQMDMSQAVMSKKNRNIMKRINYAKEQKQKVADKLQDKAKQIKKKGASKS